MGNQCDNCRKFGGAPNAGWLYLVRQNAEPSFASMLSGGTGSSEIMGTFCSALCVAAYAYVLAAASETAPGTEPYS
jgi:hypothetical protein